MGSQSRRRQLLVKVVIQWLRLIWTVHSWVFVVNSTLCTIGNSGGMGLELSDLGKE